LDFLKLFIESL